MGPRHAPCARRRAALQWPAAHQEHPMLTITVAQLNYTVGDIELTLVKS